MLAAKTIANPKSAATSEKTENPAHAAAKPTLNPTWARLALGLQSSDTALRRPATPGLQFKLTINQPGDEHEQEADRVSEQVMRMTGPGSAMTGSLQRKCACGGSGQAGECDECRQEQGSLVQRRATRETGSVEAPPNVHEVLRSPGQALDPATRAFYEMRFGHDFGDVRIHTDAKAAESAKSVDALAYTAGRNVVFGAGQYTGTPQGRHLLAHELTHVVQQTGAVTGHISRFRSSDIDKIDPSDTSDPTYTFSNNCGWIDWSHVALVDEAQDLITRVENANASLAAASTRGAPATGEVTTPRLESHPSGVVFDSATMRVKLVRVLSAPEVLAVSLGIWKKLSIAFETNQEWSDWFTHSSFSQEDLPSNLIAFYMAKKAKGYTREQIAGPWTGGSQKDTSLIPAFIPHKEKLQWFGRTQKGGFCDALDAKASKAEYNKNPFLGKKSHSFDTPVGATGSWPAELSSIKERDDLYEVLRITLVNPSGYANLCPMYRLVGSFFTAAEDVRVVPTYRFKQAPFALGVPNYVQVEIEPASTKDSTAFKSKGYTWPQYVGDDQLVCLSSMGNPI